MSGINESSLIGRSRNFTQAGELALVRLVEKYKKIVECKKLDTVTSQRQKKAWAEIANSFNANNQGDYCSEYVLEMKYKNMKERVMAKYAKMQQERYQTEAASKSITGVQLAGLPARLGKDAEECVAESAAQPQQVEPEQPEGADMHGYTTADLSEPDSAPLRTSSPRHRFSGEIQQWCERKASLVNVQVECLRKESELKCKHLNELHQAQLKLLEVKSALLRQEAEHCRQLREERSQRLRQLRSEAFSKYANQMPDDSDE